MASSPATVSMPSPDLDQFSTLVDLVYQGATDPTKWPAILGPLAHWVGAPKCLLFTPTLMHEQENFEFGYNISNSFFELRKLWYQDDPWAKAGVAAGRFFEGNVQIGHDLLPTEQFMETDVYRKYVYREDICHLLSCVVFGINSVSGPPLVCAHFRGEKDAPFGAAEQARGQLVLPHISRSMGVMFRLRDANLKVAASLAALDQLKASVVLVRDNGQVVFANRAASRVLAEEDGLRLKARHGESSSADLVADGSPQAQSGLLEAVRQACSPDLLATEHFSKSVTVPRFSGRTPYVLQFSTLPVRNEFGTGTDAPRAIVFIADPAEPLTVNQELLRQTYALTAAEIRTAEVVVQGGTVEEVADTIGVSENTVRTQLKQIYAKTGVDSRARLVKLIYSLSST